MSIIVTVGGVDRTLEWQATAELNWEDPLNGRGTGRIRFGDDAGGFAPQDGQAIEIIDGGVTAFAGILMEPEQHEPEGSGFVFFDCQIADYNILADRRNVAENWENVALELVVSGIVTRHMDGEGITLGGVEAGPAVTSLNGNIPATESFNSLSDQTGRAWFIDVDRVMNFRARTSISAPADLDGDMALMGTVSVREDRQKYRNEQIVRAGTDEFPILAVSGRLAEQAARAAIEGTSGIYSNVVDEPSIINASVAQELAGDLLDRFARITKVVRLETRVPGFHAGQAANVNFPKHNVNNEVMLIDSVSARIVRVDDDHEIWYRITAITGDPFGGWMEHFRKAPPQRGILRFENNPGIFRVEPKPGVVVHDPPPGPFEWFQAAQSESFTVFPGATALTHQSQLAAGKFLLLSRGPVATPRQSILSIFDINSVGVIDVTPSSQLQWDELVGSSFAASMIVSRDSRYAAFFERDPGSDPLIGIVDMNGAGIRGSVTIVGGNDANTGSEGVWVGNHIYWPKNTTGDIHVIDASDPDNPVHVTDFSTSLTNVYSIVANRAGTILFATGAGSQLVVSIDISTPGSPVEDDTIVTVGDYTSLDIDENDARLAMAERANAAQVQLAVIDLTGSTLDSVTETTLSFSQTVFEGIASIFEGDRLIAWSNQPSSTPNSFFGLLFAVPEADTPSIVESFNYNHGITGNTVPRRTVYGRRSVVMFDFDEAVITYGQATFEEPVPLTIDCPLRVGFGGTGIAEYLAGDLLYADRVLPDDSRGNGELTRLGIGNFGDVLAVSGALPSWQSFVELAAFYGISGGGGGGGSEQLLVTSSDVFVSSGALQNIAELEAMITSGTTYYFRAELFYDAPAGLGHRYAIGGTAAGNVIYQIRSLDDSSGEYSLIVSGRKQALGESAGVAPLASGTQRGYTEISGSIECTGNGTIVPQFGVF